MDFTRNHEGHAPNRRSLLLGAAGAMALALPGARLAMASEVVLTVSNAAGEDIAFTLADLDAMPQNEFDTETPWLEGRAAFSGPLLRDILAKAAIDGGEVKAVALNDYAVSIPFADARDHDVIVASRLNGKEMPVREKGPLWVMYPFSGTPTLKTETNYSRCIWQLNRLRA